MALGSSLRELSLRRHGRRKRVSSYDQTGGNSDFFLIEPGEKRTIAQIQGAGKITHIWITTAPADDTEELYLPRKIVIRMYWDGEENPSVQAPLGDFFGLGHGITKNYSSAPLNMSPQDGKALNCYFPMPFASQARVEIESQAQRPIKFYFYVDYEEYDELPHDELRFHAQWNFERLTKGVDDSDITNEYYCFGGSNVTGAENYVILNAEGRGHYVGCNLNIHNQRFTDKWNWYGEGDDMIFIDGEPWPPSLHGTGTEDYFNTAWCPTQEFCTPYHGIILGGGPNWSGKVSMYRYHIEDPIMFSKSIRVTIEHGHNNHRSDDYSSTAYWYQTEPHLPFAEMPDVKDRLPLPDIQPLNRQETKKIFGI
jgi:hypothetical protein